MKLELNKVYVRTKTGIAEYMGGPNFPLGEKQCPNCNVPMEFMPLKQEFIRTKTGKILVENINGILFVCNSEPKTAWTCTGAGCSLIITSK